MRDPLAAAGGDSEAGVEAVSCDLSLSMDGGGEGSAPHRDGGGRGCKSLGPTAGRGCRRLRAGGRTAVAVGGRPVNGGTATSRSLLPGRPPRGILGEATPAGEECTGKGGADQCGTLGGGARRDGGPGRCHFGTGRPVMPPVCTVWTSRCLSAWGHGPCGAESWAAETQHSVQSTLSGNNNG